MPETKTSAATDSRHIVNMDTAENKSSVVDSEAQKTKKNTSWGVKIFKQWLGVRGESPNFETLTPQELNSLLKAFYAEVRNTDGQYYTRSSYVGIRAAIHRHLRQPPFEREFNIRQDQEFFSANNVFIGMLKKIQKLGLDVTTHYEPISERDLVKIRAYQSVDDPVSLQRKVWFDLTLGFGRMGAENQHNLTRSSFNIEVDESGCEFITSAHSEVTKRHSGYLQDLNQQNTRIYATGTSSCPVASFKVYLSKLHPENTALFQRPRKHVNRSPDPHWYTAQALGHNNFSNMMKSISQRAHLSKTYTNHCVRATTISLLSHAGVENREIMKITGHKNEQSLLMYNANLSSAQKRRYSNILQGGSVSTEVMLVGTIPPVNYPVSLEVNPL